MDHFQQNGNIKSIPHIDESNNEIVERSASELPTKKSVEDLESAAAAIHMVEVPGNVVIATSVTSDEPSTLPPAIVAEVEIIPKGYSLLRFPKEKSCFRKIMWIVIWPIHFLFMLTIPDCERPSLKKLFPITFLMCIVWIGSLSYLVAWMITIIGEKISYYYVCI